MSDLLEYERQAIADGYSTIAGIDEAGRGPLAGPVVAAAVTLPKEINIEGLTDSKQLSLAKREKFFNHIYEVASSVGVGIVSPMVIDEINILQATKKAMRDAVGSLDETPDILLIDGNQKIGWSGAEKTIVKGDSLSLSIAAASVIAKVTRDRMMEQLALKHPQYGFDRHKGYGTKEHRAAIEKFGPTDVHRKTFRGVKEYLNMPIQTSLLSSKDS